MAEQRLSLFEGFGIEIEYMIVDTATLMVRPICDRLFTVVRGHLVDEIADGPIAWSNELACHLVELKTNGPASSLDGLHEQFAADVARINEYLTRFRARLLGTGMHPWMNPNELILWPGGQNEIYESYDRIFGCKGHGWANLQSVHINLPFANDDELKRLHAAIRLLLPIIPALSASTPLVEDQVAGWMDYRMEVYRHNAKRIPSIAGLIVPEDIDSEADYAARIFAPMYRDIAQLDTGNVLQEEWLNSRGAIARFDRHAIEIRVVDAQESPRSDLAIVQAVVNVLRALVEGRVSTLATQRAFTTEVLANHFLEVIKRGGEATLPADYVSALTGKSRALTANLLWNELANSVGPTGAAGRDLAIILREGCLAQRILRALAGDVRRESIAGVYRRLAECLAENTQFLP